MLIDRCDEAHDDGPRRSRDSSSVKRCGRKRVNPRSTLVACDLQKRTGVASLTAGVAGGVGLYCTALHTAAHTPKVRGLL